MTDRRTVMEIYKALDAKIEKEMAERGDVKCKAGCHGCCFQMVSTPISEALAIAETLMWRSTWRTYLPRLKDNALAHEGANTLQYFLKKQRCAFLNENNLCDIYEVRPSTCRYYYVVSAPEDCYPERSKKVGVVNNTEATDTILLKDIGEAKDFDDFGGKVGMLPIMVIHALKVITEWTPLLDVVLDGTKGVSTPKAWMLRHKKLLVEEGLRNRNLEIP